MKHELKEVIDSCDREELLPLVRESISKWEDAESVTDSLLCNGVRMEEFTASDIFQEIDPYVLLYSIGEICYEKFEERYNEIKKKYMGREYYEKWK